MDITICNEWRKLNFVSNLNCNVQNEKDKSWKIDREIIQRFDLYDIWLELKPDKKGLTCHQKVEYIM